ncbi:response regulator transcription factor [Pseudomonas fontis]|uniref:Response regulator transcription factor n=1 Tax=Pseudomonas fontis TaxID=2942633 RepID=A0ABT5NYX8_9PSED|nr:response regulator transcription factor [Pseudomonas fontis]MDD0977141.1 response regulator transcription factor [Pseudomonas fontis]MDD0993404.1 response regulator transcription factor [Pseudomonas fontis]
MQKALVVDDHPFIRASVKLLLIQEHLHVVGETDNGIDAVHLARTLLPDLMVLDIGIPGLDGLEVIGRLSTLKPRPRVLVLTSQSARYYARRCMNAGAAGFVSKSNDLEDVRKAVQAVQSGYHYFPSEAVSTVRRSEANASEAERIDSLSDRELMILQHLVTGLSNKEIGDVLSLSNKTISTYKARLVEKLKVQSVIDMADLARRNQLF